MKTGTLDRRLGPTYRSMAPRFLGRDVDRADGHCRMSPEWLVLCVNNVCNLKCKMCDVGLGDRETVFWANLIGDRPQNMTLDLLNTILHGAQSFWPRPKVGLGFTEPLIHPKILEFCGAIVERGFYAQMTTNGTMLPRHADALVEIGLDDLVVSVDGPAEVHDRIRGRQGTFEKLYTGVERLITARERLKVDRPRVSFSFTITDENYDHILEFVRQIEPLRPARLHISHLNFISDQIAGVHNAQYGGDLHVVRSNLGTIEPEAMPVDDLWNELERVKVYVAEHRSSFPAVHITPNATSAEELRAYYTEHLAFAGGRQCTDPWHMMMVKTDGTVIPAHGRCYNVPVGRVTEDSLPAIWNGPRFVRFRQTLQRAGGTLPACSRCCGVIGKPAPPVSRGA